VDASPLAPEPFGQSNAIDTAVTAAAAINTVTPNRRDGGDNGPVAL
jgi:hypothetical protein